MHKRWAYKLRGKFQSPHCFVDLIQRQINVTKRQYLKTCSVEFDKIWQNSCHYIALHAIIENLKLEVSREGPSPVFWKKKNWFADWLIELVFYRKKGEFCLFCYFLFSFSFSPHLQPWSAARVVFPTIPLLFGYVLFHDARFPGRFIFLELNARLLCKCKRSL